MCVCVCDWYYVNQSYYHTFWVSSASRRHF